MQSRGLKCTERRSLIFSSPNHEMCRQTRLSCFCNEVRHYCIYMHHAIHNRNSTIHFIYCRTHRSLDRRLIKFHSTMCWSSVCPFKNLIYPDAVGDFKPSNLSLNLLLSAALLLLSYLNLISASSPICHRGLLITSAASSSF
jgi:hypothetical protein